MKRPNFLQRALHRFIMIKPVTAFFATRTHILDGYVLKLTGGKYTLSEALGWNIVQVVTTGAKTGQEHISILIAVVDGEKIAIIGSNFGRKPNPGWYYNLKKHPECQVKLNGLARTCLARETDGEEREIWWQKAVLLYAGYEKYKERASHRRIPVMLLEPLK
ncbi:MAG: nitroreductase family deazaflavin-dependent oxidoreductase [Anaerolineales bacterium]|jgi:deazaflavin-dependent oxidoreductase (nitroreductase family)|nr:nitroreductase family deazaflavin-dependent oxidoreductase [Anaerolineales bacterium]